MGNDNTGRCSHFMCVTLGSCISYLCVSHNEVIVMRCLRVCCAVQPAAKEVQVQRRDLSYLFKVSAGLGGRVVNVCVCDDSKLD